MPFIAIDSEQFSDLRNSVSGDNLEMMVTGNIVDVNGSQVVIQIAQLEAKKSAMGRFEQMARLFDQATTPDGRLKVETQQSHHGI